MERAAAAASQRLFMAIVAQLVRAPVCGTGGRGFETPLSPHLAFIFIMLSDMTKLA